ncbi:hypothetical protein GH714_019280 [Hevea brasiliensis]|uniref:Reverse transcriptase zinc-binding domain-containing protein n=1 Tax=Hevea brasiliensis TaxID=3981 RepID=A0A6A6MEW8_HEVBR|nr:hypothetical protein GH714_019280 [Hevea brasiliensis]
MKLERNSTSANSSRSTNDSMWKYLWNLCLPPKVRHFLYRACNNQLPVASKLHRKGVDISSLCASYNIHEETITHALYGPRASLYERNISNFTSKWFRPLVRSVKWKAPATDAVKMNVDAAIIEGVCCGLGMVLRNQKGEILMSAAFRLNHSFHLKMRRSRLLVLVFSVHEMLGSEFSH